MNPVEDELVDELEDETPINEPEVEETPEGGTPAGPDLAAQIAELRGQLTGKGDSDAKFDKLLELGTALIANQNKPTPILVDKAADDAALEAFGKTLEEMVLLKTPKEKAAFFQESVMKIASEISKSQIEKTLAQFGTPMADRMGSYALNSFLSAKQNGEYKDRGKLFQAISQHFTLDDNETQWLATAKKSDADKFLSARWRQAGGDALEASAARKAKASQLGTGKGGGDNVITLPGNQRDQRALDQLADRLTSDITDPKERAAKKADLLKRMMARMKQEEAS